MSDTDRLIGIICIILFCAGGLAALSEWLRPKTYDVRREMQRLDELADRGRFDRSLPDDDWEDIKYDD